MPLRDQDKYKISVKGEPKEVAEIRNKILTSFDGLEFVDEGHKYFLNGEELMSVSNVVSQFESEFDTVERARSYAIKNGETPEYWMDKWRFTNLKATISGTLTHSAAESMAWIYMGHPENITEENKCKYIPDKNWLIPTRPKEEAALKFWEEFDGKNMYVVLPETRIYNIGDVLKYAGTFDLLVYFKHPTDDSKSGLVIMDYKTNKDIYKDYSRMNHKMMLKPFDDLFDEPYSAYATQLSLYALALEKIGLKVIGERLIWLKEDCTYEVIKVPYLKKEFRSIDKNI